jgi:hypothetical protein
MDLLVQRRNYFSRWQLYQSRSLVAPATDGNCRALEGRIPELVGI